MGEVKRRNRGLAHAHSSAKPETNLAAFERIIRREVRRELHVPHHTNRLHHV